MTSASDQRELAAQLAGMDDDALAGLLADRGAPPASSWRDFFDAAEALLEPASVESGLSSLARPLAGALSTAVRADAPVAAPADRALAARALASATGIPFAVVAERVRAMPAPHDEPVGHPAPATPDAEAAAAEHAFTRTAALADILVAGLTAPLTRIGSGSLAAADRRRLVEIGAVEDAELADALVALADATGLLSAEDREWLVTTAGREWLASPTSIRWRDVAVRWRDALPSALRTGSGGWIAPQSWTDAHPFDALWPARAEKWAHAGALWGITGDEGTLPPWSVPLAAGGDPDLAALEAVLPPEVDRVFLQNDLTAIAPGPLVPALDLRLRTMTARESRAQASTYRFTSASIAVALTGGETADTLREFLGALSLTGVPQPLDYLIDSTARRHGLIRIGRDETDRHTVVSSDDPAVIETLSIDQALRQLGLVADGDVLRSRVPLDAVFWALADARYPVVAVDQDGRPRHLERARLAATTAPMTPITRYATLLQRLRASHSDDDSAWLERELQHAVRMKSLIDVVVGLPDGSSRTFRLEATGLGGGRLRGRDRAADVERTLPLRSILSVGAA